jgi:uncharacterized protein (TIGR01777 family)
MKIVVTGGTGFIGQALCEALAARGDSLVALLRQPGSAGALPAGTERLQWNATAEQPPPRAFAGAGGIVHLAGENVARRWSPERKRRIRESRVAGTRHLVEALAALDERPRVLVSASAIGIYGDRGDETLTEESPPGSDFLAEVCVEWEEAAERAAALGVRVVRVRIGVVLDSSGGALARLLTPFKLGLGGPVGNGRQWMSWVHRADVVGLILHALDQPAAAGALNATAPEPVRNRDFARTLGAVLRRPALVPVPALALRLAFGEMATVLLGGQRVLPARAEASGYRFRFPALEPALRHILGT